MRDGTGEGVDPVHGADHAAKINADGGIVRTERDIIGQRDTTGEMQRAGRGLARIKARGHRHRDGVRGHAAEGVGVGDEDNTTLDGRGAGPTGVVGGDGQSTVIELLEGGGRCGREVKGGAEGECLARIDLDDAGEGGVAETDLTSAGGEGEVLSDAQGGRSARRTEHDLVGHGTELPVGGDAEHAAGDVDAPGEVIVHIGKHEGAVAGLGKASGAAHLARKGQTLSLAGERSGRDAVKRARVGREGVRHDESVAIVIGDEEAEIEVRDASRLDGLVRSLAVRQRAARATDGDIRDDAGIEEDIARKHDGLRSAVAGAVMEQRDRGGETEGGRVEVTGVTGGVEDQAARSGAIERGDVRDVWNRAEERDSQERAVDLNGRGAIGKASNPAVERHRAHRAAVVEVERGRSLEEDVVTDLTIAVIDE